MKAAHSDNEVSERIRSVGAELSHSLRVMVELVNADLSIPQHIARTFGINSACSHRFATALRKNDPLAMMLQIPGPEPLRKILDTARKRGVNDEDLRRASQAVDQFERLIRNVAGDRSGLDLIIGAMVPDESSRYEPAAKQLVYRGMRQLKGIAADVQFETVFLYPEDHPKLLTNILLRGYVGYRRLRPCTEQSLGMYSRFLNPQASIVARALDNTPLADNPRAALLDQFTTNPGQVVYSGVDDSTLITCNWGGLLGNGSACNLAFAERRNATLRRYIEDSSEIEYTGFSHEIMIPTKLLIADVLLAPDIYPEWEPEAAVMELDQRGGTPQHERDHPGRYRFDTNVRVETLGTGIRNCATDDIPSYREMLAYACDQLGVDPAGFRVYRARIEYPIYGTELMFRFKLPQKSQ